MSRITIADLVVLGIAQKGPVVSDDLIKIAKSLIPEFWQPTNGVLVSAIERNIDAGFIRAINNKELKAIFVITLPGAERLRTLLLADPGAENTSVTLAAEAVQFFFLDNADNATTDRVLKRLQNKISSRIIQLRNQAKKCLAKEHFRFLWVDMEQCRLEGMAQMLADVSKHQPQLRYDQREAAE